jgi:hypothetical protein
VNALGNSSSSKTAVINRYDEGMSAAADIPLIARKIRKEYLSVKKEMTRLRIPRPRKPQQKTGLGEYRSATRPQNSKNDANVTVNDVCQLATT